MAAPLVTVQHSRRYGGAMRHMLSYAASILPGFLREVAFKRSTAKKDRDKDL